MLYNHAAHKKNQKFYIFYDLYSILYSSRRCLQKIKKQPKVDEKQVIEPLTIQWLTARLFQKSNVVEVQSPLIKFLWNPNLYFSALKALRGFKFRKNGSFSWRNERSWCNQIISAFCQKLQKCILT